MRYPSLSPSFDAGARGVFEALAATVEAESRPDRQALFSRCAGYYALLSRLPRRVRRRLQRQWRRSLAAIALLLSLGQAPALAATLAVASGVAPDIAPDGSCSLIEAIENANADAPPTHADCPAGSGADTIVLPASSIQTLTQDTRGSCSSTIPSPVPTGPFRARRASTHRGGPTARTGGVPASGISAPCLSWLMSR